MHVLININTLNKISTLHTTSMARFGTRKDNQDSKHHYRRVQNKSDSLRNYDMTLRERAYVAVLPCPILLYDDTKKIV